LTAQPISRQNEVLTPDALAFIAKLHGATADRRQELLQARRPAGLTLPPVLIPGSSRD
jgi:malate synthase